MISLRSKWGTRAIVTAARKKLLRIPAGERQIRRRYKQLFGEALGSSPRMFTEKLFHRLLALNRRPDPLMTRLADKFAAREWVANRIGKEHLCSLLWEGESVDSVPFRLLPERCVIKTNHGSGQIIVKDGALDDALATSRLHRWMSENYYWAMREGQYYNIEPRVMVEEYLESDHELGLLDYRFWCFRGRVEVIQVDDHAHSICPFYSPKWELLDLTYRQGMQKVQIEKPDQLDLMLSIASNLSRDFDFVRVDLYEARGRVIFGEMTFTPAAGNLPFPKAWNERLGAAWD